LSQEPYPAPNAALLACYRFLISFRKTRPAMLNRQRSGTKVIAMHNHSLLVLERNDGANDRLLILFNFSGEEQAYDPTVQLPLHKLFDSAEKQWHGPGDIAPGRHGHGLLRISPLSAVVYEMKLL
jgi:maltooligosyltrehalose trehalohydrolase